MALPPISIRWQSTVMKPDGLGALDARRMKEALDAVLELLKELIERWR